jgi:hypothetical protein
MSFAEGVAKAARWMCLISVLFVLQGRAFSKTVAAADTSQSAVQAAINAAVDGDIVTVPAGSSSWSSTMSVNKGITVQGAGSNSTFITIAAPVFRLSPPAGKFCRVTGFNMNGSGSSGGGQGFVIMYGVSRLDHCFAQNYTGWIVWTYDCLGVIDHCSFINYGGGVMVQNPNWGGVGNGDGSWADSAYLGTTNFLVVEDCNFVHNGQGGCIDSSGGARWVFRYNNVSGDILDNHGTDSTGRYRSTRAVEIYKNTMTAPGSYENEWRGGTGVIWSNNFTGYKSPMVLKYFRQSGSYTPWGQAPNGWDCGGYPMLDQPGRGKGNLIADINSPTCLNQQSEPVYSWGNVVNGGSTLLGAGGTVQPNRDYFDNTPMPGYRPLIYPHPLVSGTSGASTNPATSLTPGSLNFGTVQVGTTSNLTITVRNSGGGVLSGSVSTLAPFSIVSGGSYNLASNQSQVVTVRYAPSSAGTASGTLNFGGNDPATAPLSGGAWAVLPGTSWESTSGVIQGFAIGSTYIYQTSEVSDPSQGGQAVYAFNVPSSGDYTFSAQVNTPNANANSFFVNVDAQPVSPTMIWDPPIYNGFTNANISWRGTGTDTNNQFSPKVFTLSAGTHQLIIRGREANAQLGRISLNSAPPAPPSNLHVIGGL